MYFRCKLIDVLDTCGDYVLQQLVLQIVLKAIDKSKIEQYCRQLFPENVVFQNKFLGLLMNKANYETELRNFLNCVNLKHKHVVSIFCNNVIFGTYNKFVRY